MPSKNKLLKTKKIKKNGAVKNWKELWSLWSKTEKAYRKFQEEIQGLQKIDDDMLLISKISKSTKSILNAQEEDKNLGNKFFEVEAFEQQLNTCPSLDSNITYYFAKLEENAEKSYNDFLKFLEQPEANIKKANLPMQHTSFTFDYGQSKNLDENKCENNHRYNLRKKIL